MGYVRNVFTKPVIASGFIARQSSGVHRLDAVWIATPIKLARNDGVHGVLNLLWSITHLHNQALHPNLTTSTCPFKIKSIRLKLSKHKKFVVAVRARNRAGKIIQYG